jgi:hypothetical protein
MVQKQTHKLHFTHVCGHISTRQRQAAKRKQSRRFLINFLHLHPKTRETSKQQ